MGVTISKSVLRDDGWVAPLTRPARRWVGRGSAHACPGLKATMTESIPSDTWATRGGKARGNDGDPTSRIAECANRVSAVGSLKPRSAITALERLQADVKAAAAPQATAIGIRSGGGQGRHWPTPAGQRGQTSTAATVWGAPLSSVRPRHGEPAAGPWRTTLIVGAKCQE
jgi:hypothetical protein